MTVHSKIGASSASRWFVCPGSVRMCEGLTGAESEYATEGTLAHEMASTLLMHGGNASDFFPLFGAFSKALPEMRAAVQVYLNTVREIAIAPRELEVEVRFHLAQIHPDLFGTADCVIFDPGSHELWVIDYKHGAGVAVDPISNPQLLYYAVGAAFAKSNRKVSAVHLGIVQPRAPGEAVKWWDVDAVELLDFADILRERVEATEDPEAPLVAGEHCRWCNAAAICPKSAEIAEVEPLEQFSQAYDPTNLATALGRVKALKGWIKSVEDFALSEMCKGVKVPGFKVVEKRGVRAWLDEQEAIRTLLGDGYAESDIMVPAVLKTPAAIEAVVGKKMFAELLADYVTSSSTGVAYAPESDKRPALDRDIRADFSPVEE